LIKLSSQPPTVEIADVGEPPAKPVFLDGSGRRRGWVKIFGVFVGTALAATLAVLVLGITGASPFGIPGLPEMGRADVQSSATPLPQPKVSATNPAPQKQVPVQPVVKPATARTTTAASKPVTTTPAAPPTTIEPPPTTTEPPPPTTPPATDGPTAPPVSP
jgi:hypothetical protein